MSIFSKKRIIAIILFLAMILTNVAASAGTVTVHVSVDQDAAKSILTGNSIPEEQLSVIEPILSLINLLNVQVVTVEDGGQINLNLNQDNALSLSFATDEQTIRLASTLFPNYLLTINQDTLTGMMATFMSKMPGATANESGEGSMSIMPTSLPTYITSFMQVCTEAAVPGEPVKGEYQFDGYNFDTLVPVTVDVPKIKEAFRGLKEDLLKDEAVLASLQGLPQVGGEELTPENLRAAMDEFETHFPDEVTAEYYQNGDDSIPFYVTGRAVCTGKEEPSYEYSMLCKDEKNYTMSFLDHEHSIVVSVTAAEGDRTLSLEVDGKMMPGTNVYRLGTSVYTIRIPDSFTEGNRTEADIRDDMVAYMRSDETLLDFDVYQFTKEGRPDSLAAYAEQEAAEYNAFEVVTGKNINGIDVAWYRAKETYDGKEYTTLNYLFDDGDQYVEIAFWLDGETAEAEAQEIISTLAFIHR